MAPSWGMKLRYEVAASWNRPHEVDSKSPNFDLNFTNFLIRKLEIWSWGSKSPELRLELRLELGSSWVTFKHPNGLLLFVTFSLKLEKTRTHQQQFNFYEMRWWGALRSTHQNSIFAIIQRLGTPFYSISMSNTFLLRYKTPFQSSSCSAHKARLVCAASNLRIHLIVMLNPQSPHITISLKTCAIMLELTLQTGLQFAVAH